MAPLAIPRTGRPSHATSHGRRLAVDAGTPRALLLAPPALAALLAANPPVDSTPLD